LGIQHDVVRHCELHDENPICPDTPSRVTAGVGETGASGHGGAQSVALSQDKV
jgi:hypothetical protein